MPPWFVLPAAPIVGSWLGVLVRRLPANRPVAFGRSHCEHCGEKLGPAELVPVLSFIWLRGRCRHCRASIGWFYPAIELLAFAIAAAALYADGDNASVWVEAVLGWALLCAAWIDAETFRLPDAFTLPLILAGLLVTWLAEPDAVFNHAAAAGLGYLGFRLLDELYFKIRHQHGIGIGDAKLLAGAGAWLGLAALPYVIVLGGLIGIATAILTRRMDTRIAFGPGLALAFFLVRLATNYSN